MDGCLFAGDFFELGDVVEVVARHGFYDGGEGHGAALGVGDWLVGVGRERGFDEYQIPAADGGEGDDGVRGGDGGIGCGPLVLVEGLDDVVVFCEGLAEAEGEDGFAVGEVAEDVAGRPLAGRGRSGEAVGSDGVDEVVEAVVGFFEDCEGVLSVEEFCVGVEGFGVGGHGGARFLQGSMPCVRDLLSSANQESRGLGV